MRGRIPIISSFALTAVCCTGAASGAIVFNSQLENHPDGNQNPPPYGLRLDELYLQTPEVGSLVGGVGGVTTFSFDPADGGSMIIEIEMVASDLIINIFGTAFGGVDIGSTYGYGAGLYDVNFSFTMNVSEVTGPDGGWIVNPNSQMNNGTITSLGNPDVAAGVSWRFYDQTDNNNNTFKFLADGHRLGGFPAIAALDPLVGRGWVTFNSNGSNSAGTQDWLFVIPSPSAGALLVIAGIAGARRRRR